MLDICDSHISMNVESLLAIFGEVIASRALHKIGYVNVVTSKWSNLMMAAALPHNICKLQGCNS